MQSTADFDQIKLLLYNLAL